MIEAGNTSSSHGQGCPFHRRMAKSCWGMKFKLYLSLKNNNKITALSVSLVLYGRKNIILIYSYFRIFIFSYFHIKDWNEVRGAVVNWLLLEQKSMFNLKKMGLQSIFIPVPTRRSFPMKASDCNVDKYTSYLQKRAPMPPRYYTENLSPPMSLLCSDSQKRRYGFTVSKREFSF